MSSNPQYELPFDAPFNAGENPALWSPREIWVKINQRLMTHFTEDRRIDYKVVDNFKIADLAIWMSMFSNTPEGGVIIYGASSRGEALGCEELSPRQLNDIERSYIQHCPLAKPEFKRIPVIVENSETFCLAIYMPYIGKLVETNRGEAYIRYGDSKHKMSEEEKRDFQSTRQQTSFELEQTSYSFPDDFNLRIVQDFCDAFRQKHGQPNWSNEEILIDRHLVVKKDQNLIPTNCLVLIGAKDPRRTISGCRVRVQRFKTETEGSGASYNPTRDRFIEGNVVDIIHSASTAIEEFLDNVTWLDDRGRFVTTPEYPKWAWFEALVNACVHRSYSFSGSEITVKIFTDRMEIESPGGFIPPVKPEIIYETRASRNPHFMDAMRILGYVQMAREGTRRIRESMKEYKLPDPIFAQEAIHGVLVRVTLKNDNLSRKRSTDADVATYFGVDLWKRLQEHEVLIAAYAYNNEKIQVSDASRLTGRTWHTSKKDLERLVRTGTLEYIAGDYARDPKAHYTLKR